MLHRAGLSGEMEPTMKCSHIPCAAWLLAVASCGLLPMAQAADDATARQLARDGGCGTCHTIEHTEKGPNGLKPIGPAWRDVAARYRGQADALDTLTHTVRDGSSPYASHWKGKVSGLAMPPNAMVLDEVQTRELVRWILALKPAS